jgi:hypothetical protein
MPDWLRILIPSALGFITTIIAAFLSAKWGAHGAFRERWWERKERAYAEIIEALHDLIRYSDLRADESLAGSEGEHPKRKEFGQRYSDAFWKIQKATDIGAFVISDKAAAILAELRKKPQLNWNEDPPWEVIEVECRNYRDALAQLRECARRDLLV